MNSPKMVATTPRKRMVASPAKRGAKPKGIGKPSPVKNASNSPLSSPTPEPKASARRKLIKDEPSDSGVRENLSPNVASPRGTPRRGAADKARLAMAEAAEDAAEVVKQSASSRRRKIKVEDDEAFDSDMEELSGDDEFEDSPKKKARKPPVARAR